MQEAGNLNKVMTLISSLSSDKKEYMNHYLRNAPRWFLESMQVVQKEKNNVFIEEGTRVDQVHLLIDGIVRAIDYRIFGIEYDYMWFYAIKAFGAMEILLKMDEYKTTLMTVTPCTFLVVPRNKFETWMFNDMNALHMELEDMGTSLLEQARKERVFLFLQGMDRLIYLFTQIYERSKKDGDVLVSRTRKELSERSGLSIKTINRSITKMVQNGYITREGNKIRITHDQYLAMKAYLSPTVEADISQRLYFG